MIDLQTVLTYLTLISVPIGVFYHILTLYNTRKNQQQQLETRQAQLLSTYTNMLVSNESIHNAIIYWSNHPEFTYEEFKEKYPPECEEYRTLTRLFSIYETLGLLSRRGLVDVELVHEAFNFQWDKFKPIIKGWQQDMGSPFIMEHYEWLGNEWLSIQEKKTSEPNR
jgi:hypothetical protein